MATPNPRTAASPAVSESTGPELLLPLAAFPAAAPPLPALPAAAAPLFAAPAFFAGFFTTLVVLFFDLAAVLGFGELPTFRVPASRLAQTIKLGSLVPRGTKHTLLAKGADVERRLDKEPSIFQR